jgi:hypothetical protein
MNLKKSMLHSRKARLHAVSILLGKPQIGVALERTEFGADEAEKEQIGEFNNKDRDPAGFLGEEKLENKT